MDEDKGARAAVQQLFETYADDVYNLACYLLPQGYDPRDIVQEVFLRAFENWNSFRGESTAKTWLLKITRNCIYDRLRRKRAAQNYINREYGHIFRRIGRLGRISSNSSSEDTTSPLFVEEYISDRLSGEMAEHIASLQDIEDALRRLKPEFRVVIALRAIEEYSVPETAQILGWTESKVRVTMHRARKALKVQLKVSNSHGPGGMSRES